MKKLCLAMAAVLLCMVLPVMAMAASSGTCGENLTWSLEYDGTLSVTGTGAMDNFVETEPPWSSEKDSIRAIEINSGVTSIGIGTFWSCSNLCSVTIPDGVTYIGTDAFTDCDSLTEIVIPDSVTHLGANSFNGCDVLKKVTLGSNVSGIDYFAFGDCVSLTEISIPGSVTNIGNNAFSNCSNLSKVTIGSNVTNIDDNAFAGCSCLTEIVIPDSVKNIGCQAFSGCVNLKKVTIGNNVANIGNEAFCNCCFTTIVIPYSVKNIGQGVFRIGYDEEGLGPNTTLTDIYYEGSQGEWRITAGDPMTDGYLGIDENMTTIHYNSPAPCSPESSITYTLKYGILTISGTGAMPDYSGADAPWADRAKQIKSIVIEEGVTSVGNYAFPCCTSLTSVSLPSTLTSIGNDAFLFCYRLPKITIPTSVTSIGKSAFLSCIVLTEVVYPGTAAQRRGISIASGNECLTKAAWKTLDSLTRFTLPSGLTTIKSGAFSGTAAELIVIPKDVDTIEPGAFSDCPNLMYIVNNSSVQITPPDGVQVQ